MNVLELNSVLISNERPPTAVLWWRKRFLSLNFAFPSLPLRPSAPHPSGDRSVCSLSLQPCVRLPPRPQRSNSKGLETSADLMKNWSACLSLSLTILAGWSLCGDCVLTVSESESRSDTWQINAWARCGFPPSMSPLSLDRNVMIPWLSCQYCHLFKHDCRPVGSDCVLSAGFNM